MTRISPEMVREKVKELLPERYRHLLPVIMGIVETESSFNPYAARYESHFRYLVSPERYYRYYSSSPEIEVILQKTSLGLMQVMGANYRAMGYKGPLTALFDDWEKQLYYGVKFFLRLYEKYGNVPDAVAAAVAAYNAGSPRRKSDGTYVNQGYVNKVLKRADKWRSK